MLVCYEEYRETAASSHWESRGMLNGESSDCVSIQSAANNDEDVSSDHIQFEKLTWRATPL